jgi:hypothetical protein
VNTLAKATTKVVATFAKRKDFNKILAYSKQLATLVRTFVSIRNNFVNKNLKV